MQYRCSGYLSDSFTVNYDRYLRHGEISIVFLGYMSTFIMLRLVSPREHSPYQLWRSLVGGNRKFYTNLQITSRIFFPIWTKIVEFRKILVGVPSVDCNKSCPVETALFTVDRQTDMTQPIFATKTLLNVKYCQILSIIWGTAVAQWLRSLVRSQLVSVNFSLT